MKKILAIVGSRKGKLSNTYKITKILLERLVNESNDITYKIITTNDYNISNCLSCNNCFKNGVCVQDINDDMYKIKTMIEESDFIILGSPVFAHNVSGDMKTLIDRLSYWLHIYKLNNKFSGTITSATSNGNSYVNNYLKKILTLMGTHNVFDIEFTTVEPNLLEDKNFMINELNNYTELIKFHLDKLEFKSNVMQESAFHQLKASIQNYPANNAEHKYWKENKIFECNSYQEYLLKS
ncbi:TPA: flavodoxin family protein, partial [Clostridium perfringens]|nr:flavodoxin family protein [Clostridium perfringens]